MLAAPARAAQYLVARAAIAFEYRGVMELRHLRYFSAVAEALNFTRAAKKLRVAQPALSRQIRDLEEELGVRLLERGPRAVQLTEAGTAFHKEARAILVAADTAVQSVRAVARGERGEIHVGYAPTPSVELLPCVLHAFQNLAPDVRVILYDLSSEEMLRGLSEGKLQACLMVEPSSRALRRLKFDLLREYPMCVAVRRGHAFARMTTVPLPSLAGVPLVSYTKANYPDYHAMLVELFAPLGRTPQIVEEHDSGPGLIAATEIGRGVAIVPSCMAMLAGGRLELRPITPPQKPLRAGIAHDPGQLTACAEQFVTAARSLKTISPTAAGDIEGGCVLMRPSRKVNKKSNVKASR
jgi:DNA-binding transcriptional LysR family regulator